jgi:hypothetical protein
LLISYPDPKSVQYRVLLAREQLYTSTDGFQLAKSAMFTPKAIQSHGTSPRVLSVYASQSSLVLLARRAVVEVTIGIHEVRLVAVGKSSHATRVPTHQALVVIGEAPVVVVVAYPGYVSMFPTGWTPAESVLVLAKPVTYMKGESWTNSSYN